jgi:hypothetical protein
MSPKTILALSALLLATAEPLHERRRLPRRPVLNVRYPQPPLTAAFDLSFTRFV